MSTPELPALPSAALTGAMVSLDRVSAAADRLGLQRRKGGRNADFFISCPVHQEKTPSMHVSWHQGATGGMVLLTCFGCDANGAELAEALGLRLVDLFDVPLRERDRSISAPRRSSERRQSGQRRGHLGRLPALLPVPPARPEPEHQWQEVTRYPYTDAQGVVVQYVVREECAAPECVGGDGRHKRFTQLFVTRPDRVVRRRPEGFFPVLYRAPEVIAAIRAGETVWLMEGEKDADRAAALGLAATTNAQGATSFPDDLVPALAGADLVVMLDRDEAGFARAVDLHDRLSPVVKRLRLLLPRSLEEKSDFSDHLDSGATIEDLVEVTLTEARIWHEGRLVAQREKKLQQAITQAQGHLERAESPPQAAPDAEHRRFARRWVLEGQTRFEALRESVDQIRVAVLHEGTEALAGALMIAESRLERCRQDLRVLHDRAGEPVPPMLRPQDDQVPVRKDASRRTTQFRIHDGAIVEWKSGKPDPEVDEDYDPSEEDYKVILSMVVRVSVREFEDAEDDAGLSAEEVPSLGRASTSRTRIQGLRDLANVRLRYADPASGEEMEVRVPADRWRDGSWLDSLPGVVDFDHRRAGREVVQRAVMAISTDMVDRVLARSTGWHEQADGGWGYVHARGVITAEGHRDSDISLEAGLELYDLPDPIQDPQRLRVCFLEHSATMMGRLPDRVAAPVLGHVYRTVLGAHHCSVALVGQKATYKTSIAAKAMNHLGEAWGVRRYSSSMSGHGDTDNVLRLKLHRAKDALCFLDDFSPSDNWVKAQRLMEDTARMVWNQEARGRMSRDVKSTRPGHRPRAAALMTSEVMPRPGSGADRLLPIPLAPHDVSREDLFPLDDEESRHGRALLGASFIQWLAHDHLARRSHYGQLAEQYAEALAHRGNTDREGEVLGQLWAGWIAMLDFLTQVGALTDTERTEFASRVDTGLRQALDATQDPDQPNTVGGRIVELLRHAFAQGLAHVNDHRSGDCPEWPLGSRLGWRRTTLDDSYAGTTRYRYDRMGIPAGYVCADPGHRDRGRVLMIERTALESVLKAANASQTEQLLIDGRTAQVALADLGVLLVDRPRSGGVTRYTLPCRIHAEGGADRRFLVLWLDQILPVDDDGGDGDMALIPEPGPGGDTPSLEPAPTSTVIPAAFEDAVGAAAGERSPRVDVVAVSVLPSPEQTSTTKGEDVPAPYRFTPQGYPDRDGVIGWSQPPSADAPPQPCVICQRRCGMTIEQLSIHIPCWGNSTATERAAATRAAPAVSPPAPAPRQPVQHNSAPASGPAPRGAAAVVDVDGVWTSAGQHLPLPAGGITSVADLYDLGRRLQLGTVVRKGYTADGQIWVGDRLAAHLGIDVEAIKAARVTQRDKITHEVTSTADGVQQARTHGLFLGARDSQSLGRWTRLWREGDPDGVRLALIAAMNPDQAEPRLLAGNPDPAHLARRIGLLADALGYPFQHGAASTGLDLMTGLRSRDERDRLFPIVEPVAPAMLIVEDDIDWCRPPTEEEAGHAWCHGYDRGGSYLGGIAGLKLGVGEPTHHRDGTAFVKEMPGYWRVAIPGEAADWRYPALLDYTGKHAGQTRWVSTPTLQLALENDVPVEVLEAYTWPENARILDTWYGRMRDARTRLDVDGDPDAKTARDEVKEIYTKAIGMLGSHQYNVGKRTYRPDWRHLIQGKSNANILRRVLSIGRASGRWPVAIKKDTIVYTGNDPNPVTAWPGQEKDYGRGIGQWKHEGTSPIADQLPYLAGGPYRGRDNLVDQGGGE